IRHHIEISWYGMLNFGGFFEKQWLGGVLIHRNFAEYSVINGYNMLQMTEGFRRIWIEFQSNSSETTLFAFCYRFGYHLIDILLVRMRFVKAKFVVDNTKDNPAGADANG